MKKLKMANEKIINVKSFEISGDNFGWDIWYIDKENNEPLHNVLFENDLDEAKKLNSVIRTMIENIPDDERVKFTFTQNV